MFASPIKLPQLLSMTNIYKNFRGGLVIFRYVMWYFSPHYIRGSACGAVIVAGASKQLKQTEIVFIASNTFKVIIVA